MESEKRTMKNTDPLAATAAAFVSALAVDPRHGLIADGLRKWCTDLAEGMTDKEQDCLLIYALRSFIANGENY